MCRPAAPGLEAIAAHGAFRDRGSYLNYDELVATWGLPAEPTKLTAWLAGTS